MDFATRVKNYRKSKGFSQLELAVFLGVSPGTIGNWEKNRSTPIDDALSSIARKMGVGEEWLRTGEGEMYTAQAGAIPHTPPAFPSHEMQSVGGVVGEGYPGYVDSGPHHTNPSQRDDMQIPPDWLTPIVAGAAVILFDRASFERAAELTMTGRRYRLLINLEPDEPPKTPEPPPAK